jgi:hypothetical protein
MITHKAHKKKLVMDSKMEKSESDYGVGKIPTEKPTEPINEDFL